MRPPLTPGLLLATLLTASFVLACRLTGSAGVGEANRGDDVLEDLLGGSRMFVGGLAMNRADIYLHRGLTAIDITAFTNRWFQRLGAAVSPNIVQHREGPEGMKVVLPWVILAARAAPTNADYVLTQTFLFRAIGEPQRALLEIRRALADQPGSPELQLEEARIRLALNQWDRAASLFDTCANLIGPQPSEQQSPLLAEACMWRGLLYERSGESSAAVASLSSAIRLEPKMYGALSNRVTALQTGQMPQVPVSDVLARYQRMAANPLCAHDHDHGDGDHDEDGD
jgi:hypothetical protein